MTPRRAIYLGVACWTIFAADIYILHRINRRTHH